MTQSKQVKAEVEVKAENLERTLFSLSGVEMFKSFKEMPVWIEAIEVAETIFRLTDDLPKKEDYGFTSQIRRAALSISANIAEAFGRYHSSDKIHFYYYSRGSVTETQSHLEYGKRVGYISKENLELLNNRLLDIHKELNKKISTLSINK